MSTTNPGENEADLPQVEERYRPQRDSDWEEQWAIAAFAEWGKLESKYFPLDMAVEDRPMVEFIIRSYQEGKEIIISDVKDHMERHHGWSPKKVDTRLDRWADQGRLRFTPAQNRAGKAIILRRESRLQEFLDDLKLTLFEIQQTCMERRLEAARRDRQGEK